MSEDKKRKEPLKWDNDLMKDFFSPIVNPEKHSFNEGQVFRREIKGNPPKIEYKTANKDAGRKKSKDIPQSDIEEFIKEKLRGESRSKFIHQNNRYNKKGEPIWNKLAKQFLKENPYIEAGKEALISKKRLEDRLRQAYKSTN